MLNWAEYEKSFITSSPDWEIVMAGSILRTPDITCMAGAHFFKVTVRNILVKLLKHGIFVSFGQLLLNFLSIQTEVFVLRFGATNTTLRLQFTGIYQIFAIQKLQR